MSKDPFPNLGAEPGGHMHALDENELIIKSVCLFFKKTQTYI